MAWPKAPAALAAIILGFGSATPVLAAPAGFSDQDQADAICFMAFASVLGSAEGAKLSAEDRSGLTSITTYYVGKLKGRHPDLAMRELLDPAYVRSLQGELAAAGPRCSQEATEIGEDLTRAGNALTKAEPQAQ